MPKHSPKGYRGNREDLNKMKGTEESETLDGTDEADGIHGLQGDDLINGGGGNDRMRGGEGNDTLNGGDGNDALGDRSGADELNGGAGDDVLRSVSDDGEPDPASNPGGANNSANTDPADDVLTGGAGADKFIFKALINAADDIKAEYTNPDNGRIDWKGVAMENDNIHDHWVEGIGDDTVTDFSAEDGDTIVISGHSVAVGFTYGDSDSDGIDDFTLITLTSDQTAMGVENGAHDGDALGTVTVMNAILTEDDITLYGGYAGVRTPPIMDDGA